MGDLHAWAVHKSLEHRGAEVSCRIFPALLYIQGYNPLPQELPKAGLSEELRLHHQ
jgi:hypothetical protein